MVRRYGCADSVIGSPKSALHDRLSIFRYHRGHCSKLLCAIRGTKSMRRSIVALQAFGLLFAFSLLDTSGGIPFREAIDALQIPEMWVDGFNFRYYAGRKAEGQRQTFAAVIVSKNNDEIYAQLVVAVIGAMENKMVDAAAMAKGLGEK